MKDAKKFITRRVNTVFVSVKKLKKASPKDLRKIQNKKLRQFLQFCRKEFRAGRTAYRRCLISHSSELSMQEVVDILWKMTRL